MSDFYKSVRRGAEYTYMEKKSEFIASLKPVLSRADALAFISAVKKKYPDARHNVYAYSVREENSSGYSDDGEPQGSAGLPVLDVIKKRGLTDTAIVVTRYFGGILLGKGGLIRAYTTAASGAVDSAGETVFRLCSRFFVECDYQDCKKVEMTLSKAGAPVDDEQFAEKVRLTAYVRSGELEGLIKRIAEATAGRAIVKKTGDDYRADADFS